MDLFHILTLVKFYFSVYRVQVAAQLERQQDKEFYVKLWPFRRHLESLYKMYVALATTTNHLMKWRN